MEIGLLPDYCCRTLPQSPEIKDGLSIKIVSVNKALAIASLPRLAFIYLPCWDNYLFSFYNFRKYPRNY